MPRIRFYNRRFASRAPMQTPPLETASRAPWETRRRSTSRPASDTAFGRVFEPGAGPPRGHPASSGPALDGATPASGPSTPARPGACGSSAAAFSAGGSFADSDPLTPVTGARGRDAGAPRSRSPEPVPAAARQCHPRSRARGAFHRPRPPGRPFELPSGALSPLAGGDPAPHGFIGVAKPRLDLSSRRFRGGLEAACARTTSASGRLHEHGCGPAEHPGHRIRGRDDCLVGRRSPFSRQPPKFLGVRGREHRVSTLPTRIAPGRDFAPTPTASGRLLSRAALSPRSGVTWGKGGAATGNARLHGARPERVVKTPHFREEAGRPPTRGAFHRRTVRDANVFTSLPPGRPVRRA